MGFEWSIRADSHTNAQILSVIGQCFVEAGFSDIQVDDLGIHVLSDDPKWPFFWVTPDDSNGGLYFLANHSCKQGEEAILRIKQRLQLEGIRVTVSEL